MKTFQDLEKVISNNESIGSFILKAINEHKSSELYKIACDAYLYYQWKNPTIMRYEKIIYTLTGKAVPDIWSANHKCAGNFFDRFVTQEVQYLLGNGVLFNDDSTKKHFGEMFDNKIKDLLEDARIGGLSFGFFNKDHLENFNITEFVPLWDEETGYLKAGIRFWQIDSEKPLRATLYELDGYTDYIRRKGKDIEILNDKRTYQQIVTTSIIDGTIISDGYNYSGFPIIPMWGSKKHQSSIVGLREEIDSYDFIRSGFCNDLDEFNQIYWLIKNAGGMDDVDIAKFIQRAKINRAAITEDDSEAEMKTVEIPYQAREAYLDRIEHDMYRDAMAVNTEKITAGNVTATAIISAYQSLDDKTDGIEYCVTEFIMRLLELVGIDDAPTYKRNRIVNQTEETNMILASAQYLDDETILKHLPFISPDEVESILDNRVKEESSRFADANNDNIDNDDIDETITRKDKE